MKYALGFTWIILSFVFLNLLTNIISKYVFENNQYFMPLYFGFISYLISLIIVSHRKYQLVNTFFHEISHLIFAILIFAKPKKFIVTSKNKGAAGYITYTTFKFLDPLHNHLVALAPYFFMPTTFFFAFTLYLYQPIDWLESLSASTENIKILLYLVGFSYAYHSTISIVQARPAQSDFDKVGFLYGIIFSFFMHLVLLTIIIVLLCSRFGVSKYIFAFVQTVKLTIA